MVDSEWGAGALRKNFQITKSSDLTPEVLAFIRKGSPAWPNIPGNHQIARDADGTASFTLHYDKRAIELFPETFMLALAEDSKT